MALDYPDFTSKEAVETLIVYGLVGEPDLVLRDLLESDGAVPPLTNRYAIVSARTEAIRLSTPGWMTLSLNQRLGLETSDDLFTFCRERLLQNTPPFSGPAKLFLKAYMDFIKAKLTSNRDQLLPTGQELEIFTYQDFAFAAWLPLPEARILLPPHYSDDGPAFAETSVAFRVNGRITAVLIDGTETVIRSRQRKLDYLRENHPLIDLVRVPIEQLRSGAFPASSFPDEFLRFWEGVDLPFGPCPPIIEVVSA